jgi:hypothetical protein
MKKTIKIYLNKNISWYLPLALFMHIGCAGYVSAMDGEMDGEMYAYMGY